MTTSFSYTEPLAIETDIFSRLRVPKYDDISTVLNDTTIGGETAIGSGVKYAVIGQTTASIDTTEAPASYRSHDRSVAFATTSDRSK